MPPSPSLQKKNKSNHSVNAFASLHYISTNNNNNKNNNSNKPINVYCAIKKYEQNIGWVGIPYTYMNESALARVV